MAHLQEWGAIVETPTGTSGYGIVQTLFFAEAPGRRGGLK